MYDDGNEQGGAAADVVPPLAVPDLLRADPGAMSGADLVDAIAESERLMSAVAAWQMRALAAFAVPGVAGDPYALAGRLAGREVTGPADSDPDVLGSFVLDAAQSMAAGEVAAAFRISPVTAGVKVRDAIRMCTELPATLAALSAGVIDRGKARVIAEYTAPLPAHLAGVVEGRVLPIASAQSTAATRKATAAAVITVDPRGAQERHEQARRERGLLVQPGTDGMSTLKAYLAADGAVSIFQLADLLATHTVGFADDDRSIGARRVDALTDLAGQILTHGQVDLADYLTPDTTVAADTTVTADTPVTVDTNLTADATGAAGAGAGDHRVGGMLASTEITSTPTLPPVNGPAVTPGRADQRATRRLSRQGRRPHLQVTLGLHTLAGLDDLPADLAGYGAITAGMARTIAASAGSLCTLLADPTTGAVTHAGTHQYRPRQDLRDHLTALADSCRFPSCRQPAWRCDIDHRNPYDHHRPTAGGPTTTTNLDPLCRRHHLFKHHTDWTLRRNQPSPTDPAGLGITWTSPTGHTYPDPPRQVTVPLRWRKRAAGGPDGTAALFPGMNIDIYDPEPMVGSPDRDDAAPRTNPEPIPEVLERLHRRWDTGPTTARGLRIAESDGAGTRETRIGSGTDEDPAGVRRRQVGDIDEIATSGGDTENDTDTHTENETVVSTEHGPSTGLVEDDLVSLLLLHHFRTRSDRSDAPDEGAAARQPGEGRDEPPPF
ncbi:DUF222 domain-containing protein [Nakamurella flavida]|uniref:DUF222 domain-containing protein n=1 Tax=Nakamurella flavida TaxID=363630 RepID=A0A939C4E6_9ACTN|nr:HNH endonuclease signature motif containing protein [Nakamurella flavida]MBM9478021.1 DUF222 domain-containing protein [Nakamurella flavida]MDP9778262.1 hypothetical protein [Nakamurella flavida]